jgi:hypothetical protein
MFEVSASRSGLDLSVVDSAVDASFVPRLVSRLRISLMGWCFGVRRNGVNILLARSIRKFAAERLLSGLGRLREVCGRRDGAS